MPDTRTRRTPLSLEPLKPVLPALVVACLLLALWFVWSGWQQQRDTSRQQGLEQSRDQVVSSLGKVLAVEQQRFTDKLADADLLAAAKAGDRERAAELLAAGWPGASNPAVLSPQLYEDYAALPEGGYGRLAALEAALVENQPVSWVVRDGDALRLALAAPIADSGHATSVALVFL